MAAEIQAYYENMPAFVYEEAPPVSVAETVHHIQVSRLLAVKGTLAYRAGSEIYAAEQGSNDFYDYSWVGMVKVIKTERQ